MTYSFLTYDVASSIATITLNRPEKLNAFFGDMRDELVDAARRASGDAGVRAVVLTGAGRGFCAGGDVTYMSELMERQDRDAFRNLVDGGRELAAAFLSSAKPVIAAVNGIAAGGGMSLALCCDIRIAATTASFSQAFVKVGMHPDWGATYLLPRLIGAGRALELALTGRVVSADEALAIGLVSKVVPASDLLAEATALAASLAALPPLALAAIKRTLVGATPPSLDAAFTLEAEAQDLLFATRDAREAMAAFREKRKGVFSGA